MRKTLAQIIYITVVYSLQLSLIFSIYRSAAVSNGMYVLLGLGLVGFLAVEVIMVSFV